VSFIIFFSCVLFHDVFLSNVPSEKRSPKACVTVSSRTSTRGAFQRRKPATRAIISSTFLSVNENLQLTLKKKKKRRRHPIRLKFPRDCQHIMCYITSLTLSKLHPCSLSACECHCRKTPRTNPVKSSYK